MKYALCAVSGGSGKQDFFTYAIPADLQNQLKVGDVVSLPFRNKKCAGIVLESAKKPKFETREITGILDGPLPEHIVKIMPWMRDHYASPFSEIVKTVLPQGVLKKRREVKTIDKKKIKVKKPLLNKKQEKIVEDVLKNKDKPHLIFGVTGSGKTEIYLELAEKMILNGKQALILVPEVALTPQTIQRFEERFPGKTALYHSYLKETERSGVWKDILNSQKQVIIGSRSALFLPFQNLGLIVIDEEHETSYKQDQNPRYLTSEVAEKIKEINDCILVLGSATPLIESFFYAKSGKYYLHEIPERFIQDKMPETEIVDMRNEFKYGNLSVLSEKLQEEIKKVLANNRQVVLFLNRRGFSTFVSCRDCGYIETCPRCEIPLVYHEVEDQTALFCHHCNYRTRVRTTCPKCGSQAFKYFGKGTQKIEAEIKKFFPNTKVKRMDADSVRKNHKNIYEEFKNKDFDILVGTQMIAKGWDLPGVDLVGIISADNILNMPDFRASERGFSLITQVSGRTGRGQNRGQIILQTYNPENPILKMAAKHDYKSFFEDELPKRKELSYPPFSNLVHLSFSDKDPIKVEQSATDLNKKITQMSKNNGFSVIGPSPAFIPKVNNQYKWQIILKVNEAKNLDSVVEKMVELIPKNWKIDVNPMGAI